VFLKSSDSSWTWVGPMESFATSAPVRDPSTMSAPRKVDTSNVVSDWSFTSADLTSASPMVDGLDLPVDDVGAV